MREYHLKIDVPVVPARGEPIVLNNASRVSVGARFARLASAENRFLVLATDGQAYEIAEDGRSAAGARVWRVERLATSSELDALGAAETRDR